MNNDETTPPCSLCGKAHVGIVRPCFLLLRGAFLYSEQYGCEVFAFDDEVQLLLIDLENGMKAAIVPMQPTRRRVSAVVHESCAEEASERLEMLGDLSEEEAFGMTIEEERARYRDDDDPEDDADLEDL